MDSRPETAAFNAVLSWSLTEAHRRHLLPYNTILYITSEREDVKRDIRSARPTEMCYGVHGPDSTFDTLLKPAQVSVSSYQSSLMGYCWARHRNQTVSTLPVDN